MTEQNPMFENHTDGYNHHEVRAAVNQFANRTPAPSVDPSRIRRAARRRSAGRAGIAAAAVALIASGSALAWAGADRTERPAPAAATVASTRPSQPALDAKPSATTAGPQHGSTVTLPPLRNQLRADAEHQLDKLGLRHTVSDGSDRNVAAGRVISSYPRPGTAIRPGTTIHLVVSSRG
ncbi:hypothetical protein BIV57_00805 [Mangrovactinospora gilvigrisea]|uniref:PASTA domain-containing protein n=1 Tax=Mangrovactinospora gilvigrisea TaxID=1428644 RepID=A0A1J7BL87_9ACTN|nr:PASTA domain-containing protein [Mangrovactinospora gilvigrisea]OIV39414.1 hypothetical protein BIV57_00805 [Mangrovactinospora gilvigrisea]